VPTQQVTTVKTMWSKSTFYAALNSKASPLGKVF